MLVSANDSPIQEVEFPVEVSVLVRLLAKSFKELGPEANLLPSIETRGDGRVLAITPGKIAPGSTRAKNPKDAVKNLAMRQVGASNVRFLRRKKGLQSNPLFLRYIASVHAGKLIILR